MTIDFATLLRVANFPKDQIDKLMENIDYLTEEGKLQLSNKAWYFIGAKFFATQSIYEQEIEKEVQQGKRAYNPNDQTELEIRLINELAQKLGGSADEVRKQLVNFMLGKFENS